MMHSREPARLGLCGIEDAPPAVWREEELEQWRVEPEAPNQPYTIKWSKANPTPGTGRTGVSDVPPNHAYPFYSKDEKYIPIIQSDGGQLSEWSQMYAPTAEEAEADRKAAYAAGIPHGYKAATKSAAATTNDAITLWVVSDLHNDSEYGSQVDPKAGLHSGGPFIIKVSPKTRVEQLRNIIRDEGGIVPALQKLSYAGKHMDDAQRTLEHYGVAYWHKRFPHWPITIRKY